MRRFYEIVEFQRNGRSQQTYYYEKVASAIPLSSGYMNKKYIINYAETLKEKGYIESYDTSTYNDRIVIEFPERDDSEESKSVAPPTSLVVKISIVLNKRKKQPGYSSEELAVAISDPTSNVLGLGEDELVSNLQYVLSLRKQPENFMGYLKLAVRGDWAKDSRKVVERKKAAEQAMLFGQGSEENDSANRLKTKEARKAIFEKFFLSLPE